MLLQLSHISPLHLAPPRPPPTSTVNPYTRGVKLIFTGGHISLLVAFKGPNVISGLYKCNYSLTVKELKLHPALWRQL